VKTAQEASMASRIKEADARKKWCPFVQIAAESQNYFALTNRGATFSSSTNEEHARTRTQTRTQTRKSLLSCVGSDCMAWDPSDYAADTGSCGLVR
jgi:hypothetical protein